MTDEVIKSGIDAIGNVTKCTHLCHLYQTREDLIDILVPYFKAGLENNQLCLWVTPEPLTVEEAKAALGKAVADLDKYAEKGQIEILSSSQWYAHSGDSDTSMMLEDWVKKKKEPTAGRFGGIRVAITNPYIVNEGEETDFTRYEVMLDSITRKYRMFTICSYPLSELSAARLINVVNNHQSAVVRHDGRWLYLPSTRFREVHEQWKRLVSTSPVGIYIIQDDHFVFSNPRFQELTGYSEAELSTIEPWSLIYPEDRDSVRENAVKMLKGELSSPFEYRGLSKDGRVDWVMATVAPILYRGRYATLGFFMDITKSKRAEEALRESEERFCIASQIASDVVYERDLQSGIATFYGDIDSHLGYETGGYPRTMEGWRGHVHPEDLAWIERQSLDQMEPGVPYGIEYRMRKKDGTYMTWWDRITVTRDKKTGKPAKLIGVATDVTERKRAEEALRESERRYRELADSLPQIVFEIDEEGNLTFTNRYGFELTGYAPEDLKKGTNVFQLFIPQDRQRGMLNIQRVLSGEKLAGTEYTILRKDGSTFPVLVYSTCITCGGKAVGLRGIVIDITRRKQMEEALRLSEQNFRNSIENSPLGISIVTAEGELLYANKALLDILGYGSFEELKNTPRKKRHTPESYAEHRRRVERRGLGLLVPSPYEVEIVRKDGEVRHLLALRKEVIWNGETQFQVLYQDITEQKRAERALQLSEEFNASLCAHSPTPILVLNPDTSTRYVNPALEKLTGFSAAELVGTKAPYPWFTEQAKKEYFENPLRATRKGVRSREWLFRGKNGRFFWVESIVKQVRNNREFKYYLENWVDLTEQKRIRANLEFYITEITRAQEEERKRIAREIHDDSVQNLALMSLELDAIASHSDGLPRDIVQRLERVRAQANDTLSSLRRFSHELRPDILDKSGLTAALEILADEMSSAGTSISLELKGLERRLNPETEVVLFRVAQEALRNIMKHSRATKAVIGLGFSPGKVRLTVSDNGVGFKLPQRLGDFASGGKLGLLGMQERIRLLSGTLSVKSEVDKGTTIIAEVRTSKGPVRF